MPKEPVQFAGGLHVHRLVSDMKISIDFYVTVLGFFYDHGIREMAWLSRDGMLLTLSPASAEPMGEGIRPAHAGFNPECGYFGWRLDNEQALELAYGDFHRKGLALSAPPQTADGRPWFFLYDPDGYAISFSCVALDYPAGKVN